MGLSNKIFHGVAVGCCLTLSGLPSLHAQPDSSYSLPLVVVSDAPSVQIGYSGWTTDSIPLSGVLTMADRLFWENPVTVRTYAPAALATLSARGAGPARTAVFWQGVNLQSSMNGVVDVSLLPLWPDDRVDVQFGGQSSTYSAGAMGGVVQVRPGLNLPDSVGWSADLGASAGSFGNYGAQGAIVVRKNKAQVLVRGSASRAENNFPYSNTTLIGAPVVRQANNKVRSLDLQGFGKMAVKEGRQLEVSTWYQDVFREIPPSMTESPAQSEQIDKAIRAVLTWTDTRKAGSRWQHRLAWLDEQIRFRLTSDIDSSRSRTAYFSSEYFKSLSSRFTLRASMQAWYQQARSDGYADTLRWFSQRRAAALVMGEYHCPRLRLTIQARQEWAENQGAPFTWSTGGRWTFAPGFYMRFHLARNFNLPTFNDRFWQGLGNPDLKPESGYSAESGLGWAGAAGGAEAAVYHLQVDDWILWQPGPDGLFRPGNLRAVWSRGLEASAYLALTIWRARWQIRGRYQFVRATNTAVYGPVNAALDKVLPYTPEHSGGLSLSWATGGWSAIYFHQWTGRRYTTSDNSTALPGFHTGNFLIQRVLSVLDRQVTLYARIENCWNAAYQVVAYRPMPGRGWRTGVQWEF